jgi:crotonobetainyl-CoA:carnitine CoA-transferase CaiB-like acyl-CoA transferase
MMSITGEPGREPQKAGVADLRHLHRPLFGDRHPGRAAPRRGDRRRPAHRHGAARHADLGARQPEPELSRVRQPPVQMGNAHMNIAPYEVLPVKDGHFILAVGNDGQFRKFCGVVGLDDLRRRSRLRHQPGARRQPRRAARQLIIEALADGRKRRPARRSWMRRACPPARSTYRPRPSPTRRRSRAACAWTWTTATATCCPRCARRWCCRQTPLTYERPSPRLGEHTDEILAELERQNHENRRPADRRRARGQRRRAHLFCVPGESYLAVLDALHDSPIKSTSSAARKAARR